jgi:UMP-CMP kinase
MSGTVNYNAFVDAVYAEDTGDSTIQELKTQRIKAVASQPDDGRDPYDMTMASTRGLLPVVSERPRRKNKPRYDAKSNTYTTKARGSSVLFVVGGPSSGKSGLCHALSNEAGYVHIDVPYLLQLEAEHGTGREAQQFRDAINAQRMVPVETTIAVIRTAIQDNAEQGHNQFALDGFPRSIANWKLWMKQCGDISTELIVFLDAPVDILQRRLEAQSRETGEEPESIKYRLGSYVETTVPLKQQLQDNNKLKVVACKDRPEADIFQEVARML